MRTGAIKRGAFLLLAVSAAAGFIALGCWQIERRASKLDLIARVEARVAQPPGPMPARASWPTMDTAAEAYRHVEATGVWRHDQETLVFASTVHGVGYWVMTPLQVGPGDTAIIVNRGFVPSEKQKPQAREAGQAAGLVRITGLLRASEAGGDLLRSNDPGSGRWYSRDVAAISQARGLTLSAPFFVDADGAPNAGGLPVGGLTVVAFHNSHLVYALTWFSLALLSVVGLALILRTPSDLAGGVNRPPAPG